MFTFSKAACWKKSHPFFPRLNKGQQHCASGNTNPQKPYNPYKGLHLFCLFTGWMDLCLTSHTVWEDVCLTQPSDSPKLYYSAWVLDFLQVHHHSSLTDVPAKPAACPAADKSFHTLILEHQCNGRILLTWRRRVGTVLGLPSRVINSYLGQWYDLSSQKPLFVRPSCPQISLKRRPLCRKCFCKSIGVKE